ncbi:hypothetical protein QBC39DRAFT_331014 [Podospora conica]|nr:hypothetical protein QBC39DRAFT_331014 [Schizothecium conicum]
MGVLARPPANLQPPLPPIDLRTVFVVIPSAIGAAWSFHKWNANSNIGGVNSAMFFVYMSLWAIAMFTIVQIIGAPDNFNLEVWGELTTLMLFLGSRKEGRQLLGLAKHLEWAAFGGLLLLVLVEARATGSVLGGLHDRQYQCAIMFGGLVAEIVYSSIQGNGDITLFHVVPVWWLFTWLVTDFMLLNFVMRPFGLIPGWQWW